MFFIIMSALRILGVIGDAREAAIQNNNQFPESP